MARALAVATAFLLIAVCTASAVNQPNGELVAGGEETVLRLHDLPPGYRVSDDAGCGPLDPGGEGGGPETPVARRYLKWIVENWPEGCFYEYEQLFEVPGTGPAPPLVEAETLNTPNEAVASRGLTLYEDLIAQSEEADDRGMVAIAPGGTTAHLIRGRHALVAGKSGQSSSLLIWRHGKLISILQVAGMKPRQNDRAALQLAAIQQHRLEFPTPYTEAEQDDTEVSLDDPQLRFPIYWPGPRFAPGHGLPASDLYEAFTMLGRGSGPPGAKVALWYEGFQAYIFPASGWKSFQRSLLGPYNRKWKCTEAFPVELDRGRAQVFAAYSKNFRRCPRRPPDRFYAIAHIEGTVVAVNPVTCTGCLGPSHGPYGSLRGMKAIVRGLELRPKPVY
jgi:hypothetical protein